MLIKYVGPTSPVTIAATGQEVATGDTVEVSDKVAGTPPTAAFLAAMAALAAAEHAIPRDHNACAAAREALIDAGEGVGSGLLAQYEAWAPVEKSKKSDTPKDGE
jgi:hypothetical protein